LLASDALPIGGSFSRDIRLADLLTWVVRN
jgi:hypothetical protein